MDRFIISLMPDTGYLIQQQLLRQKRRDQIKQVLREVLPEFLAQYHVALGDWDRPFPSLNSSLNSRW